MSSSHLYRVWVEDMQKMFPVCALELRADGLQWVRVIGVVKPLARGAWYAGLANNRLAASRCILMESTGQQALNANQVFDSDLLAFPDSGYIYEMKWDTETSSFDVWFKGIKFGSAQLVQLMEVRGNRYENPELLTRNDDEVTNVKKTEDK